MNTAGDNDLPDDRTAQARVRDEAIRAFARSGVNATSIRSIAEAADVSPALVIHHYGSKAALVSHCDHHVAALIRSTKADMVARGFDTDPLARLQHVRDSVPVLGYLAKRLVEGQPSVAPLLDEIVDDAVAYSQRAVDRNLMKPSADLRARTVVLTLWSLGAVALHHHARRLLDADLTGEPDAMANYTAAATEILGAGVLTDDAYEQFLSAQHQPASNEVRQP